MRRRSSLDLDTRVAQSRIETTVVLPKFYLEGAQRSRPTNDQRQQIPLSLGLDKERTRME